MSITSMNVITEGMEGDGGKAQREYMEDVATGRFYRINHEGVFNVLHCSVQHSRSCLLVFKGFCIDKLCMHRQCRQFT